MVGAHVGRSTTGLGVMPPGQCARMDQAAKSGTRVSGSLIAEDVSALSAWSPQGTVGIVAVLPVIVIEF